MHNKFAIFDDTIIITGSYNWSSNAAKNIENIVIILDKELADSFILKFNQLSVKFQRF